MPIRKIAIYLILGIVATISCQAVLLAIQQRDIVASIPLGAVIPYSPPYFKDLPLTRICATSLFDTPDGHQWWALVVHESTCFTAVYGSRRDLSAEENARIKNEPGIVSLWWSFNTMARPTPGTTLLPTSKELLPTRWSLGRTLDLMDSSGDRVFSIDILETGWPWRLTAGEHHNTRYRTDRPPDRPGMASGAWLGFPAVQGSPLSGWIPLRPIWPNILLTVALWSAVAAIIIETPIALRRRYRRKKGRCPICAYSRDGLNQEAPCPECGHRPAIS